MNEQIDRETQEIDKELARAVHQLGEMCDSVLVIVTKSMGGVTASRSAGAGNLLAQYGSAREWVLVNEHRMLLQVRGGEE